MNRRILDSHGRTTLFVAEPKNPPKPKPEPLFAPDQELWNADPHCQHTIVCAPGGGIKCTKCPGWFCY